jgi:hypothetical protein
MMRDELQCDVLVGFYVELVQRAKAGPLCAEKRTPWANIKPPVLLPQLRRSERSEESLLDYPALAYVWVSLAPREARHYSDVLEGLRMAPLPAWPFISTVIGAAKRKWRTQPRSSSAG